LFDEIASGGMATVHFGRLLGPVGFTRTVAIKRLHPQFAKDPEFVSMFLDEARLAARIRHMNVVPTLDVAATDGELFLVMDYVPGESLSRLTQALGPGGLVPQPVAVSVLSGVLQGLHAAHEARNERGEPLGLVHRDVSPHNVLVSTDGIARVLDFGIAKAAGRVQTTREGQIKGKIAYMAPEYLSAQPIDRRSDVYAVGVILWQCLTGQRLFEADNEGLLLARVLEGRPQPPGRLNAAVSPELDHVTLRALARNPAERFQTAREMAIALERCLRPATPSEVGEWVESLAGASLHRRAERMAQIESLTATQVALDPSPSRVIDGFGAPGGAAVGSLPSLPSLSPPAGAPRRGADPSGGGDAPAPSPSFPGPSFDATTGSRTLASSVLDSQPPDAASQLSTLSVVSGLDEEAFGRGLRQRRRGVALGILSVVTLASAGVLVAGAMSPRRPREALDGPSTRPPPPAESSVAEPAPRETAAPPSPSAAAPPPQTPPGAAAAVASAAGPSPKPGPRVNRPASPPATAAGRTRPTAPPSDAAPPAPAGNCTPPYTLDAQGIRHPKPQCL
jgi:serine/threonine-protein kinase